MGVLITPHFQNVSNASTTTWTIIWQVILFSIIAYNKNLKVSGRWLSGISYNNCVKTRNSSAFDTEHLPYTLYVVILYALILQSCSLYLYLSLSLSLQFNGHFPGEPGLASVCWSKRWWKWCWQLDYWSYKSCFAKLQSNHHHQQTNIQFFTGRMPFLSPNQQCQCTEWKNIIFHGLAYPKLTWGLPTLSLTTNSSWLPWGRVDMPLISPLMPVPLHYIIYYVYFILHYIITVK